MIKLYFWTLSYFKPVLLLTLLYVICGGAMIFGELMIPRRIGYLIDNIIPLNKISLLVNQILLLFGIVVLILIVKSIYNLLEQVISNKIIRNQQTELMLHLQKLGFSYYEKVPTGQILAIFVNSVNQTQQTYTFLFPQFIYSLAQFVVPSIILLYSEPKFFIAAMAGNILYIGLNHVANKKIQYYLDIETNASQASQQSLYDAIEATTELKITGSKEWFQKRTMEYFDEFRAARMWSLFWRHFRYTTVGLTLTLSIVLFYYFGLRLVVNGSLSLGMLVGYSFLMSLISRGFSVFFYIIPAQYNALNYAKYLFDFLKLQPDVTEENCQYIGDIDSFDIQLSNISFAYSENQLLINNITYTIPEGKKIAIIGESGCGKSTLLKLIGRFYDVSKGEIIIGGHDIKNVELNKLRQNIGYVFQDTYLFNMSIKENIRFGNPEATDSEVMEAAKRGKAHEFIMETEDGYETIVGERGSRLSGGQKQRISIARMILKNPKIILLDEATSALDNATEASIKKTLDEFSCGKTVIAVAHRLSTIKDYDCILVLEDGRIAEQGTYESLIDKKGIFYGLVMKGVRNEG